MARKKQYVARIEDKWRELANKWRESYIFGKKKVLFGENHRYGEHEYLNIVTEIFKCQRDCLGVQALMQTI